MCFVFFFSSRRRHTRCSRDWSSDVCSSDLTTPRSALVQSLGRLATTDPAVQAEITELLVSEDWRLRLSAAEIVAAAGRDYLAEATPLLVAMMDDQRGLDSWPARIAAAEALINGYRYSSRAV